MDKQCWKDIPGFEGRYQVSDRGEVRSLTRRQWSEVRQRWTNYKGRILAHVFDGDGYRQASLGLGNLRKVHRLVAEAFVPNPGNLPEVDHSDTDKTNCKATNLEWCTKKRNSQLRHRKTYLTCTNVYADEIKIAVALAVESGRPVLHIAREFNMSRSHVRRIAEEWPGGKQVQTLTACAYCGKVFINFGSRTAMTCSRSCRTNDFQPARRKG